MKPDSSAGPRRIQLRAAAALLLAYLAVLSGHLTSMDGFLMHRQAQALVLENSVRFETPAWFWKGEPIWFSRYGIGQSLLYAPGMAWASPLASMVPASAERPSNPAEFYLRQLYENPLYTAGGSWVHAVVTAAMAFVVARMVSLLGGSLRASLWAMAFLGLGSSALVYAQGDFAQPLTGLCWTAAMLFALRVRQGAGASAQWGCAAAIAYGIATRPFEGVLVIPAVLAMVVPTAVASWNPRNLRPALTVLAAATAGVVVTLGLNAMRTGDPLVSGYTLEGVWKVPSPAIVAHVLVGPARGVIWEMPALVLLPFGVAALSRRGGRLEAMVVLVLCAVLLVHTASWKTWWGGWCWGLRLFFPALPLLAVLTGLGVDRLRPSLRHWMPAVLLLAGFARALPGVVVDQLGGFAQTTDAWPLAWTMASFAPYGAWSYLRRPFALTGLDTGGIDILWFRLVKDVGPAVLVVPAVLLVLAAIAAWSSRRMLLAFEAAASSNGLSGTTPPTAAEEAPPSRSTRG